MGNALGAVVRAPVCATWSSSWRRWATDRDTERIGPIAAVHCHAEKNALGGSNKGRRWRTEDAPAARADNGATNSTRASSLGLAERCLSAIQGRTVTALSKVLDALSGEQ